MERDGTVGTYRSSILSNYLDEIRLEIEASEGKLRKQEGEHREYLEEEIEPKTLADEIKEMEENKDLQGYVDVVDVRLVL